MPLGHPFGALAASGDAEGRMVGFADVTGDGRSGLNQKGRPRLIPTRDGREMWVMTCTASRSTVANSSFMPPLHPLAAPVSRLAARLGPGRVESAHVMVAEGVEHELGLLRAAATVRMFLPRLSHLLLCRRRRRDKLSTLVTGALHGLLGGRHPRHPGVPAAVRRSAEGARTACRAVARSYAARRVRFTGRRPAIREHFPRRRRPHHAGRRGRR